MNFPPLYDQSSFRGRTAVPDPSGVDAAFDASDVAINTDWSQLLDEQFRVRFLIMQTASNASIAIDLATEFKFQWQNTTQATGWVSDFSAGNHVIMSLSSGFADNDATSTARLGSGTLVNGEGLEVAPPETGTITFSTGALSETELEISLELNGGQVNNGDLIELRALWAFDDEIPPATVLNAYTNIPIITASVPSTGSPWNHYHQQMN